MPPFHHVTNRARVALTQVLALAVAITGVMTLPTSSVQAASDVSTTYGYTGSTQTFTVPDGVTSIEVTLTGGQGGRGGGDSQGSPQTGGYQGAVTGTIAVTPGQELTIAVGGGGKTGASSANSTGAGAGGLNPLDGYDGARGGNPGNSGSSGAGGGSGAATVLIVDGTPIVAGGAGGNGGNGQFEAIVGRRAESTHTVRPDAVSTNGRPGWDTVDACTRATCDGGASGAGGGGAAGGERGTVQYGGATATEYFGFGGFPGANDTAGLPGLGAGYNYYAANGANGSLTISYSDGSPSSPMNLAGTSATNAVDLTWTAPLSAGASPITDYLVEYGSEEEGGPFTFDDGVSTGTSTQVTGLTNGVSYYFQVTAINDIGSSAPAVTAVAIVPSDVPGTPTVDDVTVFGGGASVDFTPGDSDIEISSYEYRLDGGVWQTGSVNDDRMTITGLTNGSTYSIEIRAINDIGPSLASSPAVSATPIDVPQAPTGTLLTADDGTIDAAWTAPAANNGSAVTDYVIQWATSVDGEYTTVADGVSTDVTHEITGLTNGTEYFVRIGAVNGAGTGPWSALVSATPYTTPSAPAIDVASGDGSLTVDITPGFDGGSDVTSWQYQLDGGAWTSTGSLADEFTVFGLTNATSYDIAVRASNAAGIGAASDMSAATPRTVPAAPAISAVALNTGAVSVSFTVGATGGSAITNVEYSIDGGENWITRSPVATTSPLTVSGLTGGQTYPIQLRVLNDAGASAPSNTSSVTAKGTPAGPTIVVTSADSALVVTFDAPANGGSPITNYEYSLDNGESWVTPSPAATSPLTITGLTNGTPYDVRLRAVNVVGFSQSSTDSTATPRTVPGAPTIDGDTIVGETGTLSAAFTVPVSDGGSTILTYQYSTDAGLTWRTRDAGTVESPLVITTESADGSPFLTGGETYPVELRAVNAAGPGTASAVAVGIPTTVPDAPAILATAGGNEQATVQFTPPANGGSAIVRYEYRLDEGAWVDTGTLDSEFLITGLTNATSPSLELRAVNGVGDSTPSTPVVIDIFSVPGAPTLEGITSDDQALDVAFVAGADGGAAISGYEYSTDGGETWRERSSGTTASPITIDAQSDGNALVNGTVYDVQIRAVNAAGSGSASESQLAAPRGTPAAPTGFTVTGADSALVIAFVAGSDGGSPITAVEYQLDGGEWIDAGSLSSPFSIPGLANGTTYDAAVRTRNAVGTSPTTTDESATARTVADAPTGVTASGASGQATVAWSAPVDDGGAEISGYTVRLFEALTGGESIGTCTTTDALTCIVTGLTNGVTVYADVVAVNEAGAGPAALPRAVATPLGVPSVQIDSIVSSSTTLSIVVDLVDDGGRPISDYEYQLDDGDWSSAASGSTPFPIAGLTTGVEYSVRIRATGVGGTSEPSDAVVGTPYGLPGAPTALIANSGAASADLSWTAPAADGGAAVTDYVVQYATSVSGPFATFADGTSAVTEATVTGLTNATTYYFRVAAQNAAGPGTNSPIASTTPLAAPSAPTINTVTPGSSFLQVAFTTPASDGGSEVTGYQYRLDGGIWRNTTSSTSPTTITGLDNGTEYDLELRAVNAVGGGAASNVETATPYGLPGAIVGFRATPGASNVLLEWDAADASGSPISSYNVIRWSAANEGSISASYTTTGTSQNVTGLGSGTYYFTVEATNAAGTGPRSTPRTTAVIGSTLPSAPTGLDLAVDDTTADLDWAAGAAGAAAITSYLVQYSTDGSTWSTLTSGSTATSANFELPSTAAAYQLRVAAISAVGVGAFATIAPPLAGAGEATTVTADGADFESTVDANGDTISVAFEYAVDPDDLGTEASTIISASPSSVTGSGDEAVTASASDLDAGTVYSVRTFVWTAATIVVGPVFTFTTDASIVTTDVSPAYTGAPITIDATTMPVDLEVTRTFVGIDGTTYPSSTTPPTDVGTYRMTTMPVDDAIAGSEIVTLTITPKLANVTAIAVDRVWDGTTEVDLTIGLVGILDGEFATVVTANISASIANASVGVDKTATITVDGALLTGDDAGNYNALISDSVLVTITKAAQTLSFTSDDPDPAAVSRTYVPTAVSTAGLTPTLSITEASADVCSLTAGTVTFDATGTCTIAASQPGTTNVSPATTIFQTLTVTPRSDTALQISIAPTAHEPVAGSDVVVKGAGLRPGSTVTITLDSTSIAPRTATVRSDGTYSVTVTIPADIASGAHRLVTSGIAWDDSAITAVEEFFVDWTGALANDNTGGYVTVAAKRILDTRELPGRLDARTEYRVSVPDGLVGDDATTLTLNLTVTEPTGPGYITVYPCGSERPFASATNFTTGETRANVVDIPFADGDRVCLWSLVDTDALIDVQGYHSSSGGSLMAPQVATRLLDSRSGAKLDAGETRVVRVVGTGRASASTTAVALNIAATETDGAGFITVFPCGTDRPLASNLNFLAGQTVSNEVFVEPGADGTVCIYTLAATHVVVDLDATFAPGGSLGFSPVVAGRLTDTRSGGKLDAGETRSWKVADGVSAVALNVAATETEQAGFLTVFPCDTDRPDTSNVNFSTASQTASNHVTVAVDDDGMVCVFASASTHVVLDVEGVYRPLIG